MLAARMPEAYKVDIIELPVPDCGDDQVLLKNLYLGVCASDQQIYHGRHKYMTFPLIMGHEVVSVVEAVGKNVVGLAPGDRVVLEPQVVCGACYPCSVGRFNVCEHLKVIGVHMDGCACEYIAVSPWNLHKLPDSVDNLAAALVEPLAVGMGAARRAGDLTGANVAVIGAGIIGNFAAQCARALGAAKVVISDVIGQKLKLAESCGLVPVDASKTSLSAAIAKEFGDFRKADVIIDCAATKGSFASAMEAARRNSTVVFTGNYKDTVEFDVPVIQRSEISLVGHMMYVKEDFVESIRCLAERRVVTDGLVTQHFALRDYQKAFEFADEHPQEVVKMLIDIAP